MKRILIISLIMLFSFTSIVLADVKVPEKIDVGLFYGSTAKKKITMKALTDTIISGINIEKDEVDYEVGKNSIIIMKIDEDNKDCIEVYIDDKAKDKLQGEIIVDPEYDYENNNKIILESKEYRGNMKITRKSGANMMVVNNLSMQHYLYSVVPSEIEATSPIEAIKAQAVAARTYTIAQINRHKSDGFNLCSNMHCQMYRGTEWETSATRKAVDETENMVMTYNDKVISAFYFASSGGYTENVENVWTEALPYLRAVEDNYEPKKSPWVVTYTKEELEEILEEKNVDIGEVIGLEVTKYTDSGRANKIVFYGTKGQKEYSKEYTRSLFNLKSQMYTLTNNGSGSKGCNLAYIDKTEEIKSIDILDNTLKTIKGNIIDKNTKILTAKGEVSIEIKESEQIPTEYVFTGYGSGHGVGMSQNGAKGMAEAGFDFKEILTHYYTGVIIQK